MYALALELLQPFTILMLAIGICLLLGIRKASRTVWLRFALCFYVTAYLFCLAPVAWYFSWMIEGPYVGDNYVDSLNLADLNQHAIVVLAAGAHLPKHDDQHTMLGDATIQRCLRGAEVHRRTRRPLIVSGGKVRAHRGGASMAEAMKGFLQDVGVSEGDVMVEAESWDTFTNAEFTFQKFAKQGITKIFLVTSAPHLARATRCFEEVGFEVTPIGCSYGTREIEIDATCLLPKLTAANRNQAIAHEWLGFFWFRLSGKL